MDAGTGTNGATLALTTLATNTADSTKNWRVSKRFTLSTSGLCTNLSLIARQNELLCFLINYSDFRLKYHRWNAPVNGGKLEILSE